MLAAWIANSPGRNSLPLVPLLWNALMRSWTALIGSLIIAITLLTGGVAHAVERFDCIPSSVEIAGHYDGDGDQLPTDPQQGVAHHHAGCSGHQLATPATTAEEGLCHSAGLVPVASREAGLPGRSPDSLLRPPIA